MSAPFTPEQEARIRAIIAEGRPPISIVGCQAPEPAGAYLERFDHGRGISRG